MRMIDRIKQAMRDTGVCDGMSDEDLDIAVTASLEAMRGNHTFDMKLAGSREWKPDPLCFGGTFGVASATFDAMIDAALNE